MVKTRHGGGDGNEADESVDIEVPHCSSQRQNEPLGTKESCINVCIVTFLSIIYTICI